MEGKIFGVRKTIAVYVLFPLAILVVIGVILAGTLTSGSAKKTKAAIRLVSKSHLVILELY
jgi:hypothetical protein